MQQQEIHDFLLTYFSSNQCEVMENRPGYLTVQLTSEMDKALMNRPFYWHYIEKTGGEPNPAKLTLITNPADVPDEVKGEMIHFGSPRLHKVFESTKSLASYIRLYEDKASRTLEQIPLYPWLGLNVKISYQCDLKRDVFMSLGLNMISGAIVEGFHDYVLTLNVTPKIPDFSFTLSPLIMPKSAISRLDTYIRKTFEGDDHIWAEEAVKRWETDLVLLEHFYEEMEEKSETYYTEKEALRAQYEPKIVISIINGGLFYLSEQPV
ncbi:hypothetical protein CVD28_23370 [Bacillus sp. M6-12]|uniref:YqhG family protein n=1 Tax=Bacillus sp. M6-12 TaxID=2054166 RepID=UPI000C770DBB|nr:YqhG family protein [Bacillus sp. M6-12]PLS15271.1 hypothetical protein CVD28_23370 [Bacillus sp. M6-12]